MLGLRDLGDHVTLGLLFVVLNRKKLSLNLVTDLGKPRNLAFTLNQLLFELGALAAVLVALLLHLGYLLCQLAVLHAQILVEGLQRISGLFKGVPPLAHLLELHLTLFELSGNLCDCLGLHVLEFEFVNQLLLLVDRHLPCCRFVLKRFDLFLVGFQLLSQEFHRVLQLLVHEPVVCAGHTAVAFVCATLVQFSFVNWTLRLFEVFAEDLAFD